MNQNNSFEIESRFFSLEKLINSVYSSKEKNMFQLNYEDFLKKAILKELHSKESIVTFEMINEKYEILKIGNNNGLIRNEMVIEPGLGTFPGKDTNKMEFWLNEKSISGITGGLSFTLIRFREIYTQFLRVEFERDYFCKIIEICNEVKGEKGGQNIDKDYFQAPKANISDISRNSAAEELSKNAREKLFGKNENLDKQKLKSKRVKEEMIKQWGIKSDKEALDLESNDFFESLSNSSQHSVVAYYPLNDYNFKNVKIFYQKMRPVEEQKLLEQLIQISKHYFPKVLFEEK